MKKKYLGSFKISILIMIKILLEEFYLVVLKIVAKLGYILGVKPNNERFTKLRLCMVLKSNSTLKLDLQIKNLITNWMKLIFIDYKALPIRCQFCLKIDL